MKAGCCGLGVFAMIFRFLGKVFDMLVDFFVYTGAYFPLFYSIVILCLWGFGGMEFVPSTELTLFYVGLVLSLLCSIILLLRHMIFEPFGRYLDRRAEKRQEYLEEMRARRDKKHQREIMRERRERAVPMDNRNRDYYNNRMDRSRPYVYRSRRNPSLIIYEYRDRFEVFREEPRGLRHIDTKWKR